MWIFGKVRKAIWTFQCGTSKSLKFGRSAVRTFEVQMLFEHSFRFRRLVQAAHFSRTSTDRTYCSLESLLRFPTSFSSNDPRTPELFRICWSRTSFDRNIRKNIFENLPARWSGKSVCCLLWDAVAFCRFLNKKKKSNDEPVHRLDGKEVWISKF